ncbi:hypothetical protein AKJ64_00910 [candidate division MSBL1 archaeon SCGC-AAA259E17]|uniref:DNA2/NAM7 helicase-like C-terminal domain-containing protein n=1 Tax=candidate division MSBL1 archaeon SCGC-AAA259E17 TaxID=1698263 RepID=A0A133UGK8_9EURY|nr:hypothetical protein AKJ64_00910 [candidate division MSBL1 archaeon SCGC-AAA259E17]
MSASEISTRPPLDASGVGEYIRFSGCPRYFKLRFEGEEERKDRAWAEAFKPLSVLLYGSGDQFEEEELEELREEASAYFDFRDLLGSDSIDWAELREEIIPRLKKAISGVQGLSEGSAPAMLYQVPLKGEIEAWPVKGKTDLILIWPLEGNSVKVRVMEIKASWKEKSYHQIQASIYALLLENILREEMHTNFDIEAGVIYRQTDIPSLAPEDAPSFDLAPRYGDIKRFMKEGGEFDRIHSTQLSDLRYQLDSKCNNCIYSESCFTCAIEGKKTALLGLRRGEQKSLSKNGIQTLDDLAGLKEIPRRLFGFEGSTAESIAASLNAGNISSDLERRLEESGYPSDTPTVVDIEEDEAWKISDGGNIYTARLERGNLNMYIPDSPLPYRYEDIPPKKPDKVEKVLDEPSIRTKLDRIVQRSQSMLREVHPSSSPAKQQKTAPWIMGSGDGKLPADNPPFDADLGFEQGSLIRVYLSAQWDYMRDQISLIAGRVSSTNMEEESIGVSKLVEEIPDDREETRQAERELLEEFFRDLFLAIQTAAERIGNPEEAAVHLYFYTRMERDRLMDAIRRHGSLASSRAVRDLLGLRSAIDQPMFSILQEEVKERKALKYPSTGLLPLVDQLYHPENGWFSSGEWGAERSDGTHINLQRAFYRNFFNYEAPYRLKDDGSIELMLESGAHEHPDQEGWYPVRASFGNQIPLEYIWAAKGKLDESWARNPRDKAIVQEYQWHDSNKKEKRVTGEDLRILSKKLCKALEHVERSMTIRNTNLGKEPIEVPDIPEFSLGESRLDRACREYLDLEYFTKRQRLFEHYALSPKQRVETGKSVVFRCTSVSEDDDGMLHMEGDLLYDDLGFSRPDYISNACRVKGSDGYSSGDWMLMAELEQRDGRFREARSSTPRSIEHSIPITVERIDTNSRSIEISAIPFTGFGRDDFSVWHYDWTINPAEAEESNYTRSIEEGDIYILDSRSDSLSSARAADVLQHSDYNPLYNLLNDLLNEREISLDLSNDWDEPVSEFTSWLESDYFPSPNGEQKDFINDTNHQLSLLQGPPGTGKTEAALGYGVLSRVYASSVADSSFSGIVTAPSNKAIHEILSDVARCWREHRDESDALENLRIIRVLSKDPSARQEVEGVEYLNYHESESEVEDLADHLLGQRTLDSFSEGGLGSQHVLIFTTPVSLYGLIRKMRDACDEIESIESVIRRGRGFFDLLAVDEASMMQLPDLILSGAFIKESAQVMISGDHRQMPPVQVHNWDEEDRRTIEEIGPFLSALNFLRFLRGEIDLEYVSQQPRAEISMKRLKRTYRCHKAVAELLRKWVYSKDEIDFHSKLEHTMEEVNAPTEGLEAALDPDYPLVLITHDERESQQSNVVEAEIVESITDLVGNRSGIVTPHNAQRGLLKDELDEDIRVDTVERFQGGQEDIMILSGTVSDPDYVKAESDFLLNQNRLNVALSRMKKKLIVIASKSIFEFVPPDADEYEEALLWRGLHEEVEASKADPLWRGDISELLEDSSEDNINVEIYGRA